MKSVVLFVDDEPGVTSAMRRTVRDPQIEVVTANSGDEALRILRERRIDVIVSDEKMPGMRGSQLLIKVFQEFPDTIRMMLSGQAELESAVAAINDARIFRFLLKPCAPLLLREALDAAFSALELQRKVGKWHHAHEIAPGESAARLARALATCYPVFQPIFDARTGATYAFEALCRLTDAEIKTPPELLELAESLDAVVEVERTLRRNIAAQFGEIPEGVRCFVNIHPCALSDDEFIAGRDALAGHASRIVLEITERGAVDELEDLDTRIAQLRSQGYLICIDDLGAGYAGLCSFARLSPDIVKFDMELVRNIDQDRMRHSLVTALTALCKSTGVLCVAEGIETEAERRCVTEIGVTFLQGYLLGRPERTIQRDLRRAA